MQVVVAGGTGYIGRHVCEVLARRGDKVTVLTRSAAKASAGLPPELSAAVWDPATGEGLEKVLDGVDAVINLCGENVAEGRWTAARKKLLESSRLGPIHTLVAAMGRSAKKPRVFISASGIGYYGNQGNRELSEADGPGEGFLAQLAVKGEEAARPASEHGTRVVTARIGIVLSAGGGAMEKILPSFNSFVGGPLGNGKQWWPWVHLRDVSGLIVYALSNDLVKGAVNFTAPNPVTNEEFSLTLARLMGRPCAIRVPNFALRLMVGEMAEALLLASLRVLPAEALAKGYFFRYETIEEALKDIVGTYRSAAPNRWWPNQGKTVSEGRRIDERRR